LIEFRPGPVGSRYSVLVGVNQFDEPGLAFQYCVNDIRALAATLSSAGYQVLELHDELPDRSLHPTLAAVRAALGCSRAAER